MSLTKPARNRLADQLQQSLRPLPTLRMSHTVPVGNDTWLISREALARSLDDFIELLARPEKDFNETRQWISELTSARNRAISLLLALEPFLPFDSDAAKRLASGLEDALRRSASALRVGSASVEPSTHLCESIRFWKSRESAYAKNEVLAVAFALPSSPTDANGNFRAELVLKHYAYNNASLVIRMMEHLDSLGIPEVADVLAGVSAIGGLLDCDNPVNAYATMDSFVTEYLAAPDGVTQQALIHLEASEAALRHSRMTMTRARSAAVAASGDPEGRASALADVYKRVIEGPFRQYAWTLHCLEIGVWTSPPTLSRLRERLVAGGGRLGAIASAVVLPELRNSETHETLAWDGFDEQFVAEGGRISPEAVAIAVSQASSFNAGAIAGLTTVRSLTIPGDTTFLPDPEERGRMPAWDRALGYFGINNLTLTRAQLNTRNAQIRVARLGVPDLNPCFQALLIAHRLLPRIETFDVTCEESPSLKVTVSAEAIRSTMPVWEFATSTLDRMPFTTFLPMNLDARLHIEEDRKALRSVAWIAVDDVLDAIDGGPLYWDSDNLHVLDARLRVVEVALRQVAKLVGNAGTRVASVTASVHDLRTWLALTRPSNSSWVESFEGLPQLRFQWSKWGPAQRHPLVPAAPRPSEPEPHPQIRKPPKSKAFSTM